MNINNVYRRIFAAGAIGVALGYVTAVRFHSWLGILVAFPAAILLLDLRETRAATAHLARGVWEGVRKGFSETLPSGKLGIMVAQNVRTLRKFLKISIPAFCLWIGGVTALASIPSVIWPQLGTPAIILSNEGPSPIANIIIGVYFTEVLWFLFSGFSLCLIFLVLLIAGWDETRNGISFPLHRLLRGNLDRFRKRHNTEPREPKENYNECLTSYWCVWRGPDRKILSGGRLRTLGIMALFFMTLPTLLVLSIFVGVFWFGLFVLDVILSVLLALATRAAVAAGIGATLGAFLEYLLYREGGHSAADAVRFLLFMGIGGVAGCGIYALRQFLLSLEEKKIAVAAKT